MERAGVPDSPDVFAEERSRIGSIPSALGRALAEERDRWARQAERTSQMTRSNQRAILRTSKDLAQLRQEALMRAREAAEAEARRAQETADAGASGGADHERQVTSDGWPRRFGLRSA